MDPYILGKLEGHCQLVGPRKKNEGGMERDRKKRNGERDKEGRQKGQRKDRPENPEGLPWRLGGGQDSFHP